MRQRVILAVVSVAALAVSLMGCEPDAGKSPRPEPGPSVSLAPCAFEDGPGPCSWDASKRGNGSGLSFDLDAAGNVHYWSPTEYASR